MLDPGRSRAGRKGNSASGANEGSAWGSGCLAVAE
jgi:hypothetical protein